MLQRLPAFFFGHGNPMNAISKNRYTDAWNEIGKRIPKPKAILCISAHWYVPGLFVTAMDKPRTIHDFGGFPPALFAFQYPAPGNPTLAKRVQKLLGLDETSLDQHWGFDHGAWSVLCHVFPKADIPIVQLSIDEQQPGPFHLELGKKLRPLREEGVLIVGSGNIVHNLHAYAWGQHSPQPYDWAVRFESKARAHDGRRFLAARRLRVAGQRRAALRAHARSFPAAALYSRTSRRGRKNQFSCRGHGRRLHLHVVGRDRLGGPILYRRDELEAQLRQWMLESLEGNQPSYRALLTRVSSMIRGYLMNAMGPKNRTVEKVEDLVQDVLLAIHRKKQLYRASMPILPWLFAIARYRLIDTIRSEGRRPSLVAWDETLDPADPSANPIGDDRVFELEELLDCLSLKQKQILVMAKAEGAPLADIAARFNMSLSSVKVTVHRALQKVREQQRKSTGA